jgi:arylsulfatase A-like enzyme
MKGTSILLSLSLLVTFATVKQGSAQTTAPQRPNILVIFGDDIGQANISAYAHGVVGYTTPNIDRVAHEGMMFTDYYAENSCTAGRSSFITGQTPKRTGLSKVGIPGAPVGLQARDVTIAQALKPLGYATGQFGKNHLGDRNEYLPTVHGFDEFFGNLYHLNAEEEPERPYWPKDDKEYVDNNSPRGVLRAKASDKDDPTVEPHWGRVGKQTIEDTGPLNRKRMETIDDETTAAAIEFMTRQVRANKPFFTWMNATRMHVFTRVRQSMRDQAGMPGNEYADGMIEHDGDIGKLLKAVDDLGIANNTIVIYSTDNGPNQFSWPDAATTPFRSEKDTNWEGAFRVPAMVRWPAISSPVKSRRVCSPALTGSRRCLGQRATRRSRTASLKAPTSAVRPSRSISTAIISSTTSPATPKTHVPSLLISTTTANWSPFVTAIGRRYSRNRKNPAVLRSGTSRSPLTAFQNFSICAWTPTSELT